MVFDFRSQSYGLGNRALGSATEALQWDPYFFFFPCIYILHACSIAQAAQASTGSKQTGTQAQNGMQHLAPVEEGLCIHILELVEKKSLLAAGIDLHLRVEEASRDVFQLDAGGHQAHAVRILVALLPEPVHALGKVFERRRRCMDTIVSDVRLALEAKLLRGIFILKVAWAKHLATEILPAELCHIPLNGVAMDAPARFGELAGQGYEKGVECRENSLSFMLTLPP